MSGTGLGLLDDNINGTLVLTITADAIAEGTTANTAHIAVNNATGDASVEHPTNYYEQVHITKVADTVASGEQPLGGATFDVYAVADSVTDCGTAPTSGWDKVLGGEESNEAAGVTPDRVLAEGSYCVYETGVPAGYKGAPAGILLAVDASGDTVTVVNKQIGTDDGDLPFLPMTGSTGSMLLLGGGAAIIAVGVVLLAVARRRRQRAEPATDHAEL